MSADAKRRLPDTTWLDTGALAQVLSVLDHAGEEARVVGGAVRDALFGQVPVEVDIATTTTPDTVIERARAAGFKAVPTGIDHGTVTVIVDGTPFEVTTLRADVETFGRKAKVAFGRDWKVDAARRDFTMNGLSVNRAGEIFDYVGGLADIDARRVRFIGDANKRIAEDYLRILRFFRFHATYGQGVPDAAGLAACIAGREGLAQLSRERVRMETLKLLRAAHATPTLAVMTEAGLLEQILASVPLLASFENTCKVERSAGVAGDPVRRLGALAVTVAEDAERLWQRLRLTNSEHARLTSIAEGWSQVSPAHGEAAARELIYRHGPDRYVDRVLVAWARSSAGEADTDWTNLATLPKRWSAPKFPLHAKDFIKRGVEKGPRLGAVIAAAEEAWIAAGFPVDKTALAALADAALAARPAAGAAEAGDQP
ncbi:MAG TPA: CCA tRNA nucleotidyltransferase [Xanthobacteraceae bacterium]